MMGMPDDGVFESMLNTRIDEVVGTYLCAPGGVLDVLSCDALMLHAWEDAGCPSPHVGLSVRFVDDGDGC